MSLGKNTPKKVGNLISCVQYSDSINIYMLPAKHHHNDHWSSTAGDLVIAKLDSTKNEIEGVDIEGFPTIKMFKKETNEEVEYVGRKKILCFLALGD